MVTKFSKAELAALLAEALNSLSAINSHNVSSDEPSLLISNNVANVVQKLPAPLKDAFYNNDSFRSQYFEFGYRS